MGCKEPDKTERVSLSFQSSGPSEVFRAVCPLSCPDWNCSLPLLGQTQPLSYSSDLLLELLLSADLEPTCLAVICVCPCPYMNFRSFLVASQAHPASLQHPILSSPSIPRTRFWNSIIAFKPSRQTQSGINRRYKKRNFT